MEWISQSRSLMKLELRMNEDELEKVLYERMDIPNLKCLSISGLYLRNNIDYDVLAIHYLPALEKLYLTSEHIYFLKKITQH